MQVNKSFWESGEGTCFITYRWLQNTMCEVLELPPGYTLDMLTEKDVNT